MRKRTQVIKIANIVYTLMVVLFLLDAFTAFEVKSQFIKRFIYVGMMVGAPVMLIWNLLSSGLLKWKLLGVASPLIGLLLVFMVGPINIAFASSAWQTLEVKYQNDSFPFKKVEWQIQGVGALGYNRRIVQVTYLTGWFMIVSEPENNFYQNEEWLEVNKYTNEMELKSP